jgi:spore germination protein
VRWLDRAFRALAAPLAAALLLAGGPGALAAASGGQGWFTDIAGHWAEPDITALVRSGVITVPPDGLFHPDAPVSRLDFAVWMARAQELTPPGPGTPAPQLRDWSQVPADEQPLVAAAVQAGLLRGYPDGTLGPTRPITRLEMAVILGRVLETYGEQPYTNYFHAFVDGDTIPSWAAEAALPLQDQIMYGEPATPEAAIAPYQSTTRAETATLILRFLQYRSAHYHAAALPTAPAPASFLVGAWDSNSDQAYQTLLAHGTALNWLVFTGYNATADGSLQGYDSPRTLEWVRSHPLPLWVMVQNDWSDDSFLHNPAAQQRFTAQLLTVLQRSNYAGANIDFEGVPASDRDAFSAFITNLAAALHGQHFQLSVDVPSETAQTAGASWAAAYDYRALGAAVDDLVLMAYDYHYAGGNPGPVGPLDWIQNVLAYTTSVLPASKVILGLPAYGYLWASNGHDAAYWEVGMENEASQHGATIRHDPVAQEGTFTFTAGGVSYTGWFVDPQGLQARLALAHAMSLGGIIFWRLDYDAPDWWPILAAH